MTRWLQYRFGIIEGFLKNNVMYVFYELNLSANVAAHIKLI